MPALELIELYPSPWSERLRWVLDAKAVPYTRRDYVPMAGEEDLRARTNYETVPVLLADGVVVGDSNAAVDWLEEKFAQPPLLPAEARSRAQARAWEIAAADWLGPAGRLVAITGYRAKGIQPLADYFAAKYHWSAEAAERAQGQIVTFLGDLARALRPGTYLVGDGFTRADLTVVSILNVVVGHPADDVFQLDAAMRGFFGLPLAKDPALHPLVAWRDAIYRKHRGRRVTPAA